MRRIYARWRRGYLAGSDHVPQPPARQDLTRRERQIMEIIDRRGRATAADVVAGLPGRPVNATIRTMLRVLEE